MSTDLPQPQIEPTTSTPTTDSGLGLLLAVCLLVVLGVVAIFVISG
jgi:hypothetical protein